LAKDATWIHYRESPPQPAFRHPEDEVLPSEDGEV
jgi:hypothetical protein